MDSFLSERMDFPEKAQRRLMALRKFALNSKNRKRSYPIFHQGDYVLVHKDRWPQRKIKKVETQWYGPFQILEVRANSLKIAVSPSLGGEVIVAMAQVKKWSEIIDHDEEFSENEFSPSDEDDNDLNNDDDVKNNMDVDNDEDDDVQEITSHSNNNQENVPNSSTENGLPKGYFNVEAILRHKFEQGWKFLTKWENFPISASTWEPPMAFKIGKNLWNEVFAQYCNQKGLQITSKGQIKVREDPPATNQ